MSEPIKVGDYVSVDGAAFYGEVLLVEQGYATLRLRYGECMIPVDMLAKVEPFEGELPE
jgi:hypothetical protein